MKTKALKYLASFLAATLVCAAVVEADSVGLQDQVIRQTLRSLGVTDANDNPIISPGSPHALLDGTQNNDTTTSSPTRGAVVIGNSTPKWSALTIGAANKVLHSDGTDATWQSLVSNDIPSLDFSKITTGIVPIAQGGTSAATTSQNFAFIGPTSGSGAPSFRALVAGDIPNLNASVITAGTLALTRGGTALDTSANTDGQILIGQTSDHTFALSTLSAGTNVSIVNAGHSITISASGSAPHALLDGTQNNDTVAAAPTRGAIIVGNSTPAWAKVTVGAANTVLHSDGTDTTFQALVANDIPSLNASKITAGTLATARGGTNLDTSGVTNGQLLIGNTSGNVFALATITGTSNQVSVTNGASSITLATPQNIDTSANPQFATIGLGTAAVSNQKLTIGGTITATSGTVGGDFSAITYADGGTTSTTVAKSFSLAPTINFTAASRTGHYEALAVNVTETSVPSGTNYLARFQIGGADKLTLTSASVATLTGTLSVTTVGTGNEQFGSGALAGASDSTNNVAVGNGSTAGLAGGSGNSIAIGYQANAQAANCIAIGELANGTGGGVAIGYQVSTVGGISIPFVSGCDNIYMNGITSAGATTTTEHGCGGNGTNNVGGRLVMAAGQSTGSGAPASFSVQTGFPAGSGTTAQTLKDRIFVSGKTKTLSTTTSTATTFVLLSTVTDSAIGCTVSYTIDVHDGSHHYSSISGHFDAGASNSNGTTTAAATTNVVTVPDQTTFTALTTTVTATTSGTSLALQVTPTWEAGTPTVVRITYTILANGPTVITEQ